ncbi:hypothetical protein HF086_018414 [Spodoptera exigua]|uniref:Uncharacterized protein n=1 Tax=Spodoptera exigua TaxID=7107 RepID=A0A922MU84_SPOEX|nr:hypothetical protein HF086_018414 [Spodoptera exigua]
MVLHTLCLKSKIVYGLIKQSKYSAQEGKWREEEAKRKKIRDKENAILKARIEARPEFETDTELSCGKPKKKTSFILFIHSL